MTRTKLKYAHEAGVTITLYKHERMYQIERDGFQSPMDEAFVVEVGGKVLFAGKTFEIAEAYFTGFLDGSRGITIIKTETERSGPKFV